MAHKGLSSKQQWDGYCLQLPTDEIVVLQQDGNFRSGWADANTWKMIVPFVFEACVPCSTMSPNLSLSMRELPFALVQKGKKCLLVNKLGKTVKTLPYTALKILGKTIFAFSRKDAAWGIIDTFGKELQPFVYKDIDCFSPDLTRVRRKNRRKKELIDSLGNSVTLYTYDEIEAPWNGFSRVVKNGKFGIIDERGKEVAPCIYEGMGRSYKNGYIEVVKNGRYGWLDKKGIEIFPANTYDDVYSFREGLAWVEKNGKIGWANTSGEEIIPCIYDDVDSFWEGLAWVKKDGKWGQIDTKGNVIIPIVFDEAVCFHEGLAIMEKDEKMGWVDSCGKEIIPCIYEEADDFCCALARVKKDGKVGIY